MERIYDTKIVQNCPLWLVELIIEKDPLINQSQDIGLEFKGIAELKFSLN
jgi:hypothetical protein